MVVENIGGAGGLIAAGKVAHAKADGYTLLLASNGQVSLAPLLYTSMSYDPDKDLVPIIHLTDQVAVLYANAKSPYRTVGGRGCRSEGCARKRCIRIHRHGWHLAPRDRAAGASDRGQVQPRPLQGRGPGAAGSSPEDGCRCFFTFVGSAKALTAAGLVRPIAVASDKRLSSLPDVPTFLEAGVPGIIVSSWMGLMGPREMPRADIQRIADVVGAVLKRPEFQSKMADISMDIRGGTPAAFKAAIQADAAKWSNLAKTVDLKQQ